MKNSNRRPKTCVCRDCGRRLPFTSERFKSHIRLPHGLEQVCRPCHRGYTQRWHVANREVHRARNARRRALKRAALDPRADLGAIKSVYEDAYYASKFTGEPFAVDHIRPLCRGGKHSHRNLRHIPARLNNVKGGKLDHEVRDPAFREWLVRSRDGVFEEAMRASKPKPSAIRRDQAET